MDAVVEKVSAPLPVQRVTPNLRPINQIVFDYLGTFDVTMRRRTEKIWITLFAAVFEVGTWAD